MVLSLLSELREKHLDGFNTQWWKMQTYKIIRHSSGYEKKITPRFAEENVNK